MKKIFILLLLAISFQTFAQTGWINQRAKINSKDSVKFAKDANFQVPARFQQSFKIGAVTVTASGTELNILDNALVNSTELNYLVGVTSNIQTQLNAKAPVNNPDFTGTRAKIGTDTLSTKAYVRAQTGMGAEEVAEQINDSLTQLKTDALPIDDLVWMKTDTGYTHKQVVSYDQLMAYTGGGSGLNFYELKGKVGISQGFPEDGDSIIPHSAFADYSHLMVYRDGLLQWFNGPVPHNTVGEGYVLDQEAEQIIVRPILAQGENVVIQAFAPVLWNTLVPEGVGGSSPLLDSLYAYWRCNELEGPYINDEVDGYIGTGYDAGPGWTGKLGTGVHFFSAGSAITVPYDADLGPTGDKLSISVWFKLDQLPSVSGVRNAFFTLWDNTNHIVTQLYAFTDNKIWGEVENSSGSEYFVSSSGTVTTGSWYHAVLVCEGTGKSLKIYLNNVQTTGNVFSGTLRSYNGNITIGNDQATYDKAVRGNMDEIGFWYQKLTTLDVALLWNSSSCRTYPFND